MADESTLRALIRFIPAARTLKDQLEKSIHLETFNGTGDFAMQSLRGLQQSITQITNDPLVTGMNPTVPEGAGDREKVSLALLAAGQLLAFLEGQTGLVGMGGSGGGNGGNINIQKAPMINLANVHGVPEIGKVIEKAMASKPEEGDAS
jgi:hypothetical protein